MVVDAANKLSIKNTMMKLLTILFSSFWLACGNNPKLVQNETILSEEKTETVQVIVTDTVQKNESSGLSKEKINQEAAKESMTKIEEPTAASSEEIVVNESTEETMVEIEEPTTPSEGMVVKDSIEETEETMVKIEESIEPANPIKEKPEVTAHQTGLPNHQAWNKLLSTYVNDKGDVDYKSFKSNISGLEEYLTHLAENSPKKSWSKNDKLAYYINLYNAATVKLILDNYPTKSIKDIKNPWGKDWVKTGDGVLSLGDIEHKILRKMNEPRIHFAINCASFSCPKLLNKAFEANTIEAQLNQVTIDFVNDTTRNIISKEKMQLSNIFKWYKKDFTENGSLTDYIKPYTKVAIDKDTDIDYLKYDWSLNEAK